MRRSVSLLLLLGLSPAAFAQDAPVPAPGPPVAAPAPAPARAKLKVDLQKVGHVAEPVAFAGGGFRVRGTVEPFVAGQWVKVRTYLNGRLLHAKTRKVRPVGDGGVGMFVANFRTSLRGKLRVVTSHAATARMAAAKVRSGPVHVIAPTLDYGQTGYSVEVVQRLLRDRGYVTGRYGVFDERTARAVLAFRKVEEMARTSEASHPMLRRLVGGGGTFEVRHPKQGHHVEADLTHQVLALIDGDEVERIYPISSGAPATPTILGSYRVYLKGPGTNAIGMVHSSFFIRGYAIHGYASVPTYPASHGCLRVPIPDAWSIYEWIDMGDWVSTYYRSGRPRGVASFNPNPGP